MKIVPLEKACRRCEGCGQIASDADGSPWSTWLALPPGSDLAVRMGLVRPMPCPECGGDGEVSEGSEG